MKNQVKVGDILYGMWHYSMHFPVWFKVISVSNKQARAVEMRSRMVRPTDGGYGQQGYEAPDPVRMMDSRVHVIRQGKRGLETGSYARYNHYCLEKWNGQPIYANHMD